jgi:hypothetical protein
MMVAPIISEDTFIASHFESIRLEFRLEPAILTKLFMHRPFRAGWSDSQGSFSTCKTLGTSQVPDRIPAHASTRPYNEDGSVSSGDEFGRSAKSTAHPQSVLV